MSFHTIANPFMPYLIIVNHCSRIEVEAPLQGKVELVLDPIVEEATYEHQGRHLSILLSLFWIKLGVCVLYAHDL